MIAQGATPGIVPQDVFPVSQTLREGAEPEF